MMSDTPTPLLTLPGQAFTVWTRRSVATPSMTQPAGSAVPVGGARRISLPGKQFTIWTRAASLAGGSRLAKSLLPACSAPRESAASAGGGNPWLTRAALLAVPIMGALWYSDHKSQNSRVEAITQNHAADEVLKTQFQDQASNLSQQLTQRSQAMAQVLAKEEVTAKSRDEAKAALGAAEQLLRTKVTELGAGEAKLAAVTKELAAVKNSFGSKEEAWNNSLAAMKQEASHARQTLEQKELEMKNILAKAEGERAAAQKEAAAAALKVQELTAELAAMRKALPAVPPQSQPGSSGTRESGN